MHFTPDAYIKALNFSAAAHSGQVITGTDLPYILHPVRVTAELFPVLARDSSLNRDFTLQTALLHDTIEDTPVTYADIEREFGGDIARAVQSLSKDAGLPKDKRMPDSIKRIKSQPREVSIVKICDRITNLDRPPALWSASKITEYLDEARMIFRELGGANSFLSDRLEEKIKGYELFLDEKISDEKSFIKIDGFPAKIYSPAAHASVKKKHPCGDCFSCGFCSDDRCLLCLKKGARLYKETGK